MDENQVGQVAREMRTRFLRERLAQTPFADAERIRDLWRIERTLAMGGPRGFAHATEFASLRRRYPVELRCIRRELEDGVTTSPEEYRRLLTAHAAQARRDAERQALAAADAKTRARALWIAAGGRP